MKHINEIITEKNNDKAFCVMHIVAYENPIIEKATYNDLMSNAFWDNKIFFGAGDGDWSDIINKCKQTFTKDGCLVYEGDAGYIVIVSKNVINTL